MSTTEQQIQDETEGRGSGLLHRAFTFQAEATGDGRTIHVRVVPFDEVADVADPPEFRPYKEQFMPGVFARNEPHAHRIRLRSDHEALDQTGQRKSGTAGIVGNGVKLVSAEAGYEGEFRFLDTPEAMTARELVLNGGYDGVSAEFKPIRSVRTKDGVVQRKVAHLDSVALATGPAYSKAEILALREETIVDEEMMPPLPSKQLLERAQKLGIPIPDGMSHLLARAFTDIAWDGSSSRWASADAYCAASAIDKNKPGTPKTKMLCHLPYKEPGSGDVNINAVRNALARLDQMTAPDVTQADKDKARAMLERLLAQFNNK